MLFSVVLCNYFVFALYFVNMNSDDRKRIKLNWNKLVENLAVAGVCDQLISVNVIDGEEYEEIVVLEKTTKDRVRTLLRTLMRKSDPNVLELFCRALTEADSIYQYLSKSIRDTDISSVEDHDVVDSGNVASHKQDALVETVLKQSNELMNLNEQYRQQIAELTEQNEILKRRQSCLKAIESGGFTEKSLVQFVDAFVLAKNIKHSSAFTHDAAENFPYPAILKKMSSETLSQDELKACLLSICTVQHVVTAQCTYKLPDSFQKCSVELRNVIDAEMRKHPDLFNDAIQNLHIVEINGLNTFDSVADELFRDGVCNWGRVIAWFAFCASLAKKFPSTIAPDTLDVYAVFSWFYINQRMCEWIKEAGGWVCTIFEISLLVIHDI